MIMRLSRASLAIALVVLAGSVAYPQSSQIDRHTPVRAERALARRIRVARAEAKQGDIFTPAIGIEFTNVLVREMGARRYKEA